MEVVMNEYKESNVLSEDLITTNGWVSSYESIDRNHINYCTHGVQLNYNHPDFQITLPIGASNAENIARDLIEDVRKGHVFKEGEKYSGYLLGGYDLTFKRCVEGDRQVLRVIFPDKNGLMPTDKKANADIKRQLDLL
jgi:hypothetical protein